MNKWLNDKCNLLVVTVIENNSYFVIYLYYVEGMEQSYWKSDSKALLKRDLYFINRNKQK